MVEFDKRYTMGLNIKNREVESLASELAALTGESKTETIRRALLERKERLGLRGALTRAERITQVLEHEIWPSLPEEVRGRSVSKAEREAILGYGPDGV